MFTGLIEGIGKIGSLEETDGGKEFSVSSGYRGDDLEIGDSVSISGACQTVTRWDKENGQFWFYSSYKTLELTNFSDFQIGTFVNLERSVTPDTRMGGHFVTGHVDSVGKIQSRESMDGGQVERIFVEHEKTLSRYFPDRGSVAVDGISLTIVSAKPGILELVLIPETLKKTAAGENWKVGRRVNLEIDLLARYIEKLTKGSLQS